MASTLKLGEKIEVIHKVAIESDAANDLSRCGRGEEDRIRRIDIVAEVILVLQGGVECGRYGMALEKEARNTRATSGMLARVACGW